MLNLTSNIFVSIFIAFNYCYLTVFRCSATSWFRCGQQAVKDSERDVTETGRVIGGHVSQYGAHPWQIQIIAKNPKEVYQCSGAIISEYFVVTAAHCVALRKPENYLIKVGDYDKDVVDRYEDIFQVDSVVIHENYQKESVYSNDIAIIKIKPKHGFGFNFNLNYVYPVCLPNSFTPLYPSQNCLVAGWGSINGTNEPSFATVLHQVSIPLISHNICKYLYRSETDVKDGMLCAGFVKGGADTCKGDSGGPLTCLIHGRYTLFGLVSWGIGCGEQNRPGVYTRIQYYIDWIWDKIRNN